MISSVCDDIIDYLLLEKQVEISAGQVGQDLGNIWRTEEVGCAE